MFMEIEVEREVPTQEAQYLWNMSVPWWRRLFLRQKFGRVRLIHKDKAGYIFRYEYATEQEVAREALDRAFGQQV